MIPVIPHTQPVLRDGLPSLHFVVGRIPKNRPKNTMNVINAQIMSLELVSLFGILWYCHIGSLHS